MPGLISFSATLRLTGCGLLGHEDGAHAAFADLLQQLVRADQRVPGRSLGGRRRLGRRRGRPRRRVEEAARPRRGPEQLLDLLRAGGVAPHRPRRGTAARSAAA